MNLPTVLLYHSTKCLQTLVGLMPYGGRTLTPERESLLMCRATVAAYVSSGCRALLAVLR